MNWLENSAESRVLALLPEPCFILTDQAEILYANHAAADLLRQRRGDLQGKNLSEFAAGTSQSLQNHLALCARSGQMVYGSVRLWIDPERHFRTEGAAITPGHSGAPATVLLRLKSGDTAGRKFVDLNREIGRLSAEIHKRMRAEQDLQLALKEKNILLREMHHRVKNNMQIVISLLNLQQRRERLPEVQRAFTNMTERIQAMALVHESLYATSLVSKIPFDQYLKSLTGHLVAAYQPDDSKLQLQLQLEPIHLDIDQALPLGIITNELIVNSLKHAFESFDDARIMVRLQQTENKQLRLQITDNGKPLPDLKAGQGNNLGLKLVQLLCAQLGGRLDLQSEGDSKAFVVEIPLRLSG